MTKDEVAAALDEIGTLLELKGENAFRCNAYHNGARTIQPARRRPEADRRGEEARRGPRHRRGASGEDHHAGHHRASCRISRTSAPRSRRAGRDAAPARPRAEEGEGPARQLGIDTIDKLKAACEARRGRQAEGLRREDAGEDPRRDRVPRPGRQPRPHRPRRSRSAQTLLEQIRAMPGVIRGASCAAASAAAARPSRTSTSSSAATTPRRSWTRS